MVEDQSAVISVAKLVQPEMSYMMKIFRPVACAAFFIFTAIPSRWLLNTGSLSSEPNRCNAATSMLCCCIHEKCVRIN